MLSRLQFRPVLILVATPVLATLIFLASWQGMKAVRVSAQLASLEQRFSEPAQALPTTPQLNTKYQISGTLYPQQSIGLRGHSFRGVAGEQLISLLVLDDGRALALNRGWVPRDWRDPDPNPRPFSAQVMLRAAKSKSAVYNQPDKDQWIVAVPAQLAPLWQQTDMLDHPAMQLLDGDPRLRNFSHLPIAHPAKPALDNNHFGYALTWSALALALICMVALLSLKPKTEIET